MAMIHQYDPDADPNKLTEEYQRSRIAQTIFDRFANQEDGCYTMTVTDLEPYIGKEVNPRSKITEFFELLETWNWGKYYAGRRGYQSRFEANLSLKEIGQLARSQPKAPQSSKAENLRHRFLLRPDYAIDIDLPANLTDAEAIRFMQFIKSLPFHQ